MIKAVNISKTYGSITVFNGFNCRIETGEVTCFMGQSGRGKTTLLRIISGLEKPDSGQITGMSDLKLSFVFQEDRLCENLSAAANIRLVRGMQLKNSAIIESMAAAGLDADCANQTAQNMSGGQKRRLAILRALMAEYDILFMDEPFKGLDADTKEKVMLYTKEQSRGKTVVFVTHDKAECDFMGGKIINIEKAFD